MRGGGCSRQRLCFNTIDRVIFVGLYRLFPDLRDALAVVRPETVIRWHARNIALELK